MFTAYLGLEVWRTMKSYVPSFDLSNKLAARIPMPATMTRLLILVLALATQAPLAAEPSTIAQWNFNSPTPDGLSTTGSLDPSQGSGTAAVLGGVAVSFAAGASAKGQDPAGTADNTAWNTSSYPGSGSNELTAGVQFEVDTRGFENISLNWWQRHSATASRYVRVQYTIDGVSYQDATTVEMHKDSVFTNVTVDLAFAPEVADNPAFGFRLVTLFETTALGWGTPDYVPTAQDANYSRAGTIRFDLVTVTGTRIAGANTPPQISTVRDQTLRVGQTTALLVTVNDAEDAPGQLQVIATSSDWRVVPQSQLRVEGSGTERYVYVTAGGTAGTAEVTLTVRDSGDRLAESRFVVQVLPLNTPPWIVAPVRTNLLVNSEVVVPFTIGDLETPLESLEVEATSGNNGLIPQNLMVLGGTSTNRFLRLRAGSAGGIAPIRLRVRDAGGLEVETSFGVLVQASPLVLLEEQFHYPDGSLVTNSAYWSNRSGTDGQCITTTGELYLDEQLTEDVVAKFAGGPYTVTNTEAVYATFKLVAERLGKANGGLLAHFADGVSLRGRVHIITTNSPAGFYRLAVANGAALPVEYPLDLRLGRAVRVVTRYELGSCWTRLWVDPQSEDDTFVESYDSQTAVKVSAYGFRQDDDLGGAFRVDDLRVGLSFGSLLARIPSTRLRYSLEPDLEEMELSWDDPTAVLQSSSELGGPFSDVPGASSPWRVPTVFGQDFFRLR